MTNYIVCQPFGAVIKSQKAVREHYLAGKDFIILSIVHGVGQHISKAEVKRDPDICLEVRYGKNGGKVMLLPDDLC